MADKVTIHTHASKRKNGWATLHHCPHAGPFCKPENANVHTKVEGRQVFVCPQCKAQLQAGAKWEWATPQNMDVQPRAAKAGQ